MTSAIIRVATAQPSEFSQLGDVQYYTAPDVVTALRDAQQYRDINKLVTVVVRVFANSEEVKARKLYLSTMDSEFVEMTPDRPRAYSFDGPDCVIPFPGGSETKIHWVRTADDRNRVYPMLCPDNDPRLFFNHGCSVCKEHSKTQGWQPGENITFVGGQRPEDALLKRFQVNMVEATYSSALYPRFGTIAARMMIADTYMSNLLQDPPEPHLLRCERLMRGGMPTGGFAIEELPLHLESFEEQLPNWALMLATSDIELHQYHVLNSAAVATRTKNKSLQAHV